jgi:acylphosphatase
MASEIIVRHLVITGLVQGVWYRESMREAAGKLGVTGWVRNRDDGSVEAMIQGESISVEDLIDWARRGPPKARVKDVVVNEGEGSYTGFEKLHSV